MTSTKFLLRSDGIELGTSVALEHAVTDPVFLKNPPGMFTNSIPAALRNELLAKGIPALSPAAGKTEMGSLGDNNFNMNTDFRSEGGAWPRDNNHAYKQRWLHSDMKDLSAERQQKHDPIEGAPSPLPEQDTLSARKGCLWFWTFAAALLILFIVLLCDGSMQ
jgi:hypothetical protein